MKPVETIAGRIALAPPPEGRGTPVNVRMDDELLQMIDTWRTWPGHGRLTRPEAIRRLVRDRLVNSRES